MMILVVVSMLNGIPWNVTTGNLGVDFPLPHSFQPSFFSKTDRHFTRVFGGFLERIPGKNGEVTPRLLDLCTQTRRIGLSLEWIGHKDGFSKKVELRK